MCGYVASRIAMRESIEIVCNECLRPVGNITDVVWYPHNGLTSVRVERMDCDCEIIARHEEEDRSEFETRVKAEYEELKSNLVTECTDIVQEKDTKIQELQQKITQLKEQLEQCSHSNSLAEKIKSAARITHVK